jgi:hypothetical protein
MRPESAKRLAIALAAIGIMTVLVVPAFSPSVSAARPAVYKIGAAGDVGMDTLPHNNWRRVQYDDVSNLLLSMNLNGFLLLGDGQHNWGTLEEYQTYYDPYYGRLMDITYPAIGNHDYYKSDTAEGFRTYFSERLAQLCTDPIGLQYGYYSFDLGTWHIVSLNSRLGHTWGIPWSPDNPGPAEWQFEWLKKDLADHPSKKYSGTIVYMHHPYYDWETYWTAEWYPDESTWQLPIWELLYANGVDLVLGGHNHNYQRWAPQDPYGNYDPSGIRQIVAGTGGAYLWAFNHPPRPTNLVTAIDSSFGALQLTLYEGSYDIEFVSIDGRILDSEKGVPCH